VKASLAPIAALLTSLAFLLMGNGLQTTLLPLRADAAGFTASAIGIMGGAYFGGFILGCLFGARVIRRAGHIRTYVAMSALATAVVLLHSLFVEAAAWWPLRAVTGFAFAVLAMVIESWLNERATNRNRGAVMSVYTVLNLTVITVGQQLVNLYAPGGFQLFVLAAILISLAAVPIALTAAPAPAPLASVRLRLGHLYRLSPVAVVSALAVGLANGAFWALGPVFALKAGASVQQATLFMSVAVLGGAALQWPLGRLSDRIDRRKVIVGAALGAMTAALAIAAFSSGFGAADLVLVALFGGFAMPIYAIGVAHMNDFVASDAFVESSSGLLLVYGIGAVIGPVCASLAMEAAGAFALFAFIAAVYAVDAAVAALRMRVRRRPAPETLEPFVATPGTSPAVFELDPRSPDPPAGAAAGRDADAPAPPGRPATDD
jgi:MFS family permease